MRTSSYNDEIDNDPELRRLRGELKIRAPIHRKELPCENVELDGEFINVKFCKKVNCKLLLLNPTQCKNRKFRSHLDLRPKHTTLRNRSASSGWYYRDI